MMAMRELGVLEHGAGNVEGAQELLCKAADRGDVQAMGMLGELLREIGDLVGANEWWDRAAAAGRRD